MRNQNQSKSSKYLCCSHVKVFVSIPANFTTYIKKKLKACAFAKFEPQEKKPSFFSLLLCFFTLFSGIPDKRLTMNSLFHFSSLSIYIYLYLLSFIYMYTYIYVVRRSSVKVYILVCVYIIKCVCV